MTVDIKETSGTINSDGTADGTIWSFAPVAGELWYVEELRFEKTSRNNANYYGGVQQLDFWGNEIRGDGQTEDDTVGTVSSLSGYLYPGQELRVYESEDAGAGQSFKYRAVLRRVL